MGNEERNRQRAIEILENLDVNNKHSFILIASIPNGPGQSIITSIQKKDMDSFLVGLDITKAGLLTTKIRGIRK